jgi:hypothetical protein
MLKIEELSDEYLDLLELYMELKKAYNQYDHILNVSIRQAKNRDVFFNMLRNLISFFEKSFDFILNYYKYKGVIQEIPNNYFLKMKRVEELYPDLRYLFEFYGDLKKVFINIEKGNYEIEDEFRRTIKLKTKLPNKDFEINIAKLKEQSFLLGQYLGKINELLKELKKVN